MLARQQVQEQGRAGGGGGGGGEGGRVASRGYIFSECFE